MKNLERAIRVYRALAESPVQVSSSSAREWGYVLDAIKHDSGLLLEMESLNPQVQERVHAYVRSFSPLNEGSSWPTYAFTDVKQASMFVNEVTRSGAHASYVGDSMVTVDTDDHELAEQIDATAISMNGVPFEGPSLNEEYDHVDVDLPDTLLTAGIDPDVMERALIEALYSSSVGGRLGRLDESIWMGVSSDQPIDRYKGRLEQFCRPKPVFGVPAHVAEAVRISGMAPAHVTALLEVGGGAVGVKPGAQQDDDKLPADRGGIAKDQPDSRGTPAQDQNGQQQTQPQPTEHVPAQEGGAPGDVTLSNGMTVPKEVIAQATAQILQNLATQIQQGQGENGGVPKKGPGTDVPAVQAAQQQGQSQAQVGAQSDQQQPAGQSAQPQGQQEEPPQGAQEPQNGEQGQAPPQDQNGAQEAPQGAQEPPEQSSQPPQAEQQPPEPAQGPQQGQQPAQPNPQVDTLMQQAQTGDQAALQQLQGMQGQMTDEQKQALQALLQQAQQPAAAQPAQESLQLREDYTDDELVAFMRQQGSRYAITVRELQSAFGGTSAAHTKRLQALLRAGKLKLKTAAPGRKLVARNAQYMLAEAKMTKKGQGFVGDKIRKHMKKGGKPQKQAVAIALSQARKAGYKGTQKESLDEVYRERLSYPAEALNIARQMLHIAAGQVEQVPVTSLADGTATKLMKRIIQMKDELKRALRLVSGMQWEITVRTDPEKVGRGPTVGGPLYRAAGHNVNISASIVRAIASRLEVDDKQAGNKLFKLAGAHSRLMDDLFRAADRFAFGLGEGIGSAAKKIGKAAVAGAAQGAADAAIDAVAKRKKKNEGLDEVLSSVQKAMWRGLSAMRDNNYKGRTLIGKGPDQVLPMDANILRQEGLVSIQSGPFGKQIRVINPSRAWRVLDDLEDQMLESVRGKPQHATSKRRQAKATGKTSSNRDLKGKARHSREQAGGGRKYRRDGSSSDYGFARSQRKEPVMSETVYALVHEGRGTSVWEPLPDQVWEGATLPEGVSFGKGECEPGTRVMVQERGEETSLIVTPEGHTLRCPNSALQFGGFHVMEGGEVVTTGSLEQLIESSNTNNVVLVVGTPASGKSHYLRTALGPALRESILPETLKGLVQEPCVVEAAAVVKTWESALVEDANVTEQQANAGIEEAIGAAARRLFFDPLRESIVQIGETLVIDCASVDSRITDHAQILEACEGRDIMLANFLTPLDVAQSRNEMRLGESRDSRANIARQFNSTRRLVNELWADPRVTHRVSYEWMSGDALDGEYVTEGAKAKRQAGPVGKREKRQIGQRTTYDIDADDPKDPKMRKQIVTMESLTEGFDVSEETSRHGRVVRSKAKKGELGSWLRSPEGKAKRAQQKDKLKRSHSRLAKRGYKIGKSDEGIEEQLDVGQEAEADNAAGAMKDAANSLKAAREAIFKLTTAHLVQASSMAKATEMKRTGSALDATQNAASKLLDELQGVGKLLDKANEVMKGENNGKAGDTLDQPEAAPGAPAPVNTGPGQDVVVQPAAAPAPAPVPTPESVENEVVSKLMESYVMDMVQAGSHHGELSEAVDTVHPGLSARQRARVIARLETVARIPSGADITLTMNSSDVTLLSESLPHGSYARGMVERVKISGKTLVTRQELEEAAKALQNHGGARQVLLAKTLVEVEGVSS